MSECPVKLSIQQCCHIIIKDLVPANFVKIRTMEGMQHERINYADVQDLHGNNVACITDQQFGWDATGDGAGGGGGALHDAMRANPTAEPIRAILYGAPEYQFGSYVQWYDQEYPEKDPNYDPSNPPGLGYHMPYMRWWDTGVSAVTSIMAAAS